MSEAKDDYSELLHDTMSWRALRKLLDDAADLIERPSADRLRIIIETWQQFDELVDADATRILERAGTELHASGPLSQAHLKHQAQKIQREADQRRRTITLTIAAFVEGSEGRWPALFPEQKHTRGGQVDGEYGVERGYLAALLEWARQLRVFGTLTAAAKVITGETNRLGGIAGKRIEAQKIINWRRQARSKATTDKILKDTYDSVLDDLLKQADQPQMKQAATVILRNLVHACLGIDPRRLTDV
jgi:hypothetical protein